MAKTKVVKKVDDIVNNWSSRLANSTTTITNGVKAVTESPGAKAAKAKAAWVKAMTSAEVQGRWAKQVGKVTLEEWQNAMINKGIPNITTGVNNAKPKMTAFMTWLISQENTLLTSINAMPNLTLNDRINRATSWMKGMNAKPYKGYKRG